MIEVSIQEDHELAMLVRERHDDYHEAAATLMGRLGGFVIAMVSRHASLQPADVDEVAQSVWQKAFDADGQEFFRTAAEFRAWLKQVARTRAIDEFRKQQRKLQRNRPILDDEQIGETQPESVDAADEGVADLRRCLEKLKLQKPAFADVVQKLMLGKAGDDVAIELGLPANTVYTRFSRGKKMLRDCIEGSRS